MSVCWGVYNGIKHRDFQTRRCEPDALIVCTKLKVGVKNSLDTVFVQPDQHVSTRCGKNVEPKSVSGNVYLVKLPDHLKDGNRQLYQRPRIVNLNPIVRFKEVIKHRQII